jgi:uncharacterized protein involved in outer membrane biogenesis
MRPRKAPSAAAPLREQDRRMSNFIIAIAVFLITVVGALFAIPYFVDWNGYRSVFEEEATRLLGREVRVGGAVNLHLLPTPYFRFEKVRIADASVNLQEPFFRADSLTVKLAIPPMVRGVLEANEIELLRPVLRLALDSTDGWNWQSFGEALGRSAFLPAKVTLSSVNIVDGVLALHGPDGAERTRFDGFNGELSTPALEGPYRLRGTLGAPGLDRELRLATARAEGDGTLRFKAVLRVDGGTSTYTLDGRLADLMGKPSIEGDLYARVPVAGLWQAQPATTLRLPRKPARTDGEGGADKGEAAFDLRAQLRADPAGATLSDLTLAFEQDGRPQLISGELKASWRTALAVEMTLASRWLDLDRIAGASEGAGPLESIVPLAVGLRDLLPGESRSRATLAIDQANVGREAVSGVHLALVRSAGKLAIEDLRLGLPGGSRGELQGSVTGPPEAPVFEGSIGLRGTSLVRFLAWATAGALTLDPKGDGTFGARAQLAMTPGRWSLRNIVGDLSGGAVFADAQYGWEGRPELRLRIESPQLDARAFMPAGASLGEIFAMALRGPVMSPNGGQPGNPAPKPAWRGPQADAFIRLSAGQLFTSARSYRDVGMEIAFEGGRLRISTLRLAGDEGFSLELEGEVDDAALRPNGNLRGLIVADRSAGVAPLAELIGFPEAFRPDDKRAKAVAPLRIAGSMAFGARTPTSIDLVLDGEANGAGAKLNARLDGGPGGWRTGPVDVTGRIESNDAQAVAAILAPTSTPASTPASSPASTPASAPASAPGRTANAAPARVVVKAAGVPNEGLVSLASVMAGDLALEFRGRMVAGEGGNTAQGTLDIKSADGGRLAGLAGLQPPLRLDGLTVGGSLKLAVDRSKIALERLALNVAGSSVRGELSIANVGERRQVAARLDVDGLSLGGLLAVLQDQRLAVAAAAESAISGRPSVWSDDPFDGPALDGFEGHVNLSAKRLVLTDGLALDDASLEASLQSGKIDVRELAGACLGGRCRARFSIAKAPGGVDVSGSLSLAGLAAASLAADARATGSIAGEVKFSGKGVSPRSVFSVLHGGGALKLADAKLAILWPGAVGKAVEAALRTDPDSLNATLKQALGAGLSAGELPLPGEIAIDIADGRLAARPIAIDTPEGRAQGTAALDLKSLQFESDWRLEAKAAGGADKAPLPAVMVGYRGSVTGFGSLEPRIDTEALQRELAVRRMERDVEELERLRRLDEARRREEMERQRRQLERAPVPGPVPVAPVVPAPRPATPG